MNKASRIWSLCMKKLFRYRKKKPKPPRKMSYRERQAGMYLVSAMMNSKTLRKKSARSHRKGISPDPPHLFRQLQD